MSVFVVLKNTDFTEGRGPMRLHKIFADFKSAELYVMDQPSMFGLHQRRHTENLDFGHVYYSGYEIIEMTVHENYDQKRIKRLKEEREQLREQIDQINKQLEE